PGAGHGGGPDRGGRLPRRAGGRCRPVRRPAPRLGRQPGVGVHTGGNGSPTEGVDRIMAMSVSMPLGGVQVGSYDSYEQAQAAVDYLSDEKFAVENVTIIGSDLRMIERVTGRLTQGRAIAAGAAGGAWWGLFVGLLLGIFSSSGSAWIGSVLTGLAIGLAFGA